MEGEPNPEIEQLALIAELESLHHAAYQRDRHEAFGKIASFGKQLKEKYPDARDYQLYHLLIGSGALEGVKLPKFDFPGDDSVEKFLRELS